MSILLVTTLWLGMLSVAIAQQPFLATGARAQGIAYATATLDDEWSVINNPAGTTATEHFAMGTTADLMPGFPTFNRVAVAGVVPLSSAAIGVGASRFGDDLYSESAVTASFANRFGIASLGVSASYTHFRSGDIASRGLFTFAFGGRAVLTPWLCAGAMLATRNEPRAGREQPLPLLMTAGLMISPTPSLRCYVDVDKNVNVRETLKAAVEYFITKRVAVRTGFNLAPEAGFFGFGVYPRRVKVDYSFAYLPGFGARHQCSLTVAPKRRKR